MDWSELERIDREYEIVAFPEHNEHWSCAEMWVVHARQIEEIQARAPTLGAALKMLVCGILDHEARERER